MLQETEIKYENTVKFYHYTVSQDNLSTNINSVLDNLCHNLYCRTVKSPSITTFFVMQMKHTTHQTTANLFHLHVQQRLLQAESKKFSYIIQFEQIQNTRKNTQTPVKIEVYEIILSRD
jgi:hypothetical protein